MKINTKKYVMVLLLLSSFAVVIESAKVEIKPFSRGELQRMLLESEINLRIATPGEEKRREVQQRFTRIDDFKEAFMLLKSSREAAQRLLQEDMKNLRPILFEGDSSNVASILLKINTDPDLFVYYPNETEAAEMLIAKVVRFFLEIHKITNVTLIKLKSAQLQTIIIPFIKNRKKRISELLQETQILMAPEILVQLYNESSAELLNDQQKKKLLAEEAIKSSEFAQRQITKLDRLLATAEHYLFAVALVICCGS